MTAPKTCHQCQAPVSRMSKGLCRSCAMRERWKDPEARKALNGTETLRRPDVVAKKNEAARSNIAIARQYIGTRLPHIPREHRDMYRDLTRRQKFSAEEAEKIVMAHHEAVMAKFTRNLEALSLKRTPWFGLI